MRQLFRLSPFGRINPRHSLLFVFTEQFLGIAFLYHLQTYMHVFYIATFIILFKFYAYYAHIIQYTYRHIWIEWGRKRSNLARVLRTKKVEIFGVTGDGVGGGGGDNGFHTWMYDVVHIIRNVIFTCAIGSIKAYRGTRRWKKPHTHTYNAYGFHGKGT